jgi:hypothetical protein
MAFPVCIISSDGQLVFSNRVFFDLVGDTAGGIGLDAEHPFFPEYRKRLALAYQKVWVENALVVLR